METLYAYLAAAIDIDGYILIARRKTYARHQDGVETPRYTPTVRISNTAATIPDLFQATFPARRREFQPKNPSIADGTVGSRVSKGPRTAGLPVASPENQAPPSRANAFIPQFNEPLESWSCPEPPGCRTTDAPGRSCTMRLRS